MELRRYWQIILKRRYTLLMIVGVLVGTVILGSFIISPVYMFSTNILVKTTDPVAALTGASSDLVNLGTVNQQLEMFSQLAMIRNLSMIQDVIAKMHLEKKKGKLYGAKEFLDPSAMGLLRNKRGVRVDIKASSQVIEVSGFSSSPEEAKEIANQVADAFVALYNQNAKNAGRQALKFIQESLPKVAAQLQEAENAYAEYKVAHHLNDVTNQYLRQKLLTNFAALQETRDSGAYELVEIENRIAAIRQELKKVPEFHKTAVEYQNNATLRYIREKIMDAEANMASGSVRATPEYYSQKQYQVSIDKLKDEYRKQAAKLFSSETLGRNSVHTSTVSTLVEDEIKLITKTARLKAINQIIHDRQKDLDDLTLKDVTLGALYRKVTALQTAQSGLLTQEQAARLAMNVDLSNVLIVERAAVPTDSSNIKRFRWFPRRTLLTSLSLVFALLLGLTTIFFQEYVDDTLSDIAETEGYLQFPVLANLPELPPSETAELTRLMAYAPWFQAIWALPDMVKPPDQESPAGVWGITSTDAGEGKSLVAASLGWVLALRNLRVLLIDLNFFHPSLSSLWGLPPGKGVREILQGTVTFEECVRQVGSGEMYLLPNSKTEEVTWAELDPKVLAQWLTTVRTRFDVLLLDLPAVGTGEGAPLAALGEQTLLVAAAAHSPRIQVARALEQIQRCHGRIGGLVLNRYKKLELWSLLSPTLSAIISWPLVQRLMTFVEKHVKFRQAKKR